MKNKNGFTLIEILIVVAIIGILSSVVLVGLGPTQKRSRDARRISDLNQIKTGLELYYQKYNKYPAALTDLTASATNIGVSSIPKDPSTRVNYSYGTDTNQTTYLLGAKLEETNKQVLDEDIDTDLYGVTCAETTGNYYCVSL